MKENTNHFICEHFQKGCCHVHSCTGCKSHEKNEYCKNGYCMYVQATVKCVRV
jgi:hypothetical protein